jgi:hypothetical protein
MSNNTRSETMHPDEGDVTTTLEHELGVPKPEAATSENRHLPATAPSRKKLLISIGIVLVVVVGG